MKKALLILGVAVLALSSCKKEKTCTCTYTDSEGAASVVSKTTMKGTSAALNRACYDDDYKGKQIETISSEDGNGDKNGYTNCELD
jgi:hypothetical protein